MQGFGTTALLLRSLALLSLAACGGGDDNAAARQAAIEAADAQEAEARRLGVPTPCAGANQCGVLTFVHPVAQCGAVTFLVYSTVSPTAAAASAAAAAQVRFAQEALRLYDGQRPACPFVVQPAPVPACVASRCEAGN